MDVVVFGIERLSQLAAFVLKHDSPHRPVGFTVHERYLSGPELAGLPVTRFEDLERHFSPDRVALVAPLGWRRMGDLRRDVMREGERKGYRFLSHVSSRALTWPDLVTGSNVLIDEGVVVQPGCQLGEGCLVRAGALLSHDVHLGDHCFVAPRATIGGRVVIGEHCVVGLGSTVATGVTIAPRCFIAAGAVVTADTARNGIYRGNPARRARLTSDKIDRLRI